MLYSLRLLSIRKGVTSWLGSDQYPSNSIDWLIQTISIKPSGEEGVSLPVTCWYLWQCQRDTGKESVSPCLFIYSPPQRKLWDNFSAIMESERVAKCNHPSINLRIKGLNKASIPTVLKSSQIRHVRIKCNCRLEDETNEWMNEWMNAEIFLEQLTLTF
jgi:hypothetical protein